MRISDWSSDVCSSDLDFVASDYTDLDLSSRNGPTDTGATTPLILTAALARKLFPEGGALGGHLRDADSGASKRYVVIGIVRHLLRYQVGELDDGKAEYSVLVPRRITGTPILGYAVRTDPARRDAVHAAIPQVLERAFGAELMPDIGVRVDDYESLRRDALKPRRAAVWLLATVCAVVTFITLVGIASLTGYWVAQRTRQIGIRRALGAPRGQILRYFQAKTLIRSERKSTRLNSSH